MKKHNWKLQAIELGYTTTLSWRAIARALMVPRSTVSDLLRARKNSDSHRSVKL